MKLIGCIGLLIGLFGFFDPSVWAANADANSGSSSSNVRSANDRNMFRSEQQPADRINAGYGRDLKHKRFDVNQQKQQPDDRINPGYGRDLKHKRFDVNQQKQQPDDRVSAGYGRYLKQQQANRAAHVKQQIQHQKDASVLRN